MKLRLSILVLAAVVSNLFAAQPPDPRWQDVREAIDQGLPQTAIERLQPILSDALRDEDWPEAARAIGQRITLETRIQGNQPAELVTRFRQALAEASDPLKPVFHTLLGHAYWSYFNQNRWRVAQRTRGATTDPADADFQTWDLPRLFAEIDRQFTLALADDARLKSIPIAEYETLLEKGTVPADHRPTLYDFLAFEALEFYAAGEQAGVQPETPFVIEAESPALDDVREFLRWNPSGADTNSVTLKAIRLYQNLLRFHEDDENPAAFLDADLHRIRFAGNNAVGPTTRDRHIAALRSFAERARNHEISARARHAQAELLLADNKPAEAHAVAREAVERFPESLGGRACRNLILQIETPEARIRTERVWNAPWPAIEVTHKNLDRLWFRAIAIDWNELIFRSRWISEDVDASALANALRRNPAAEWSANLPPTPDFQERLTELEPPQTLPPGFYLIVASQRPDFRQDDNTTNNVISGTTVWVSDLAMVVHARDDQWIGHVVDARSGEPVANARVEAWRLDNVGARQTLPARTTDASGAFRFERREQSRAFVFRATRGAHSVSWQSHNVWWRRPEPGSSANEQTIFFTDRALYRPGQLIQYKGVCLVADPARDRYEPLAGRELTVILQDMNGRELERARHRANDFGSFAGAFTAPSGTATGPIQILVEGEPSGGVSVRVEEYKRPKFEVALDAPAATPRLAESVDLTGRATAYTGAPISGARVEWRVVRQVRFPPWFGRFRGFWPAPAEAQQVAHGTSLTREDGSFSIRFPATPDASVPADQEPVFRFEVHADVTDIAGETRSANRDINIGYSALAAEVEAGPWTTSAEPVAVRVVTRNHDGEGIPASGTLKIHRLQAPDRVHRKRLDDGQPFQRPGSANREPDLSDPRDWPSGPIVAEQRFQTGDGGVTTNSFSLAPGAYRAVLETADRFGAKTTAEASMLVIDPNAQSLDLPIPHVFVANRDRIEPGEEFVAVWGTGYESGRAWVAIVHDDEVLRSEWTQPGRTQHAFRLPVTEALRGGFTIHVVFVRENRAYTVSHHVEVPWSNKELELAWQTFRSRLEPGARETWTLTVKPRLPGDQAADALDRWTAEMVATLYDASLDQFLPLEWPKRFQIFPQFHSGLSFEFANVARPLNNLHVVTTPFPPVLITYPRFPFDFTRRGYQPWGPPGRLLSVGTPAALAFDGGVAMAERLGVQTGAPPMAAAGIAANFAKVADAAQAAPAPDWSQISARKNLQETAFFFPRLISSNGVVSMSFTLPEALTEWRFLGFAHDRQLRSGFLEGSTVAAKELMAQPNPPRFLREGDELEFTCKIVNESASRQEGRVRLDLAFALDNQSANEALSNTQPERAFDVPAKESVTISWRLRIPDQTGLLTYKVLAASGSLSDGEEGFLPILSRRVFLTESLPLPIRGPATNAFTLDSLRKAADSDTIQHSSLIVRMVSNPAWHAVLALPYLMESTRECSEQIFSRLYATALARHIAQSDPRIRQVFDQWRGTDALKSPLERNADLNAIALEETPWLRAARDESQARRNIGLLFEANRLDLEVRENARKLADIQLVDGAWPWFPGGPPDHYITLHIVSGFGRLRQLGVRDLPLEAPLRALPRLDEWMRERWESLRNDRKLDENNFSPIAALYLYARTFFLNDLPVEEANRAAFDYWLKQGREHWTQVEHRLPRGHLAIALHRLGGDENARTARSIVESLRQHAVRDPEMGMHWREDERSWWWSRAPIETHALMIEMFDDVARDDKAVEDLKVWLLKQKQTQAWKTTKATADAVHALLRRGASLLASDQLARVQLADRDVTPDRAARSAPRQTGAVEPGTGFYEVHIPAGQITPEMAKITVAKSDSGVSWGGVHWQYFESIDRVRAFEDTPLKLEKALFKRTHTASGPTLSPVTGPVKVGDELIVRLELRVDRDMEYVHLKDLRASGLEPAEALSGYEFQDGLGYYKSPRDAATHFFIHDLPKGVYVFEYPLWVQHRGAYTTGFASVECMYAPEFNSHSPSLPLRVE